MPLLAGDEALGVITLVQAESGRAYGEDDLALALELARRAATAIENARLYAEAERRAQAARALANVGDAVVLADADGVVRLWNPAAATITGIAEAAAVGRRLADVVPGWHDAGAADPGRERARADGHGADAARSSSTGARSGSRARASASPRASSTRSATSPRSAASRR